MYMLINQSFLFFFFVQWNDIKVFILNWWSVQYADKSWPILLESNHQSRERKKRGLWRTLWKDIMIATANMYVNHDLDFNFNLVEE